ncbi:MAG: N5-glutamine S-adenosyl-L-methionine-dependent methyltransferase [Anaerospora sp.]|jgi:tRNA1(Val) A37 N6-methylase TrmN6|nr:N5-glutamine S-adenosyl-L-methionine-dependent methyltransferase [Anaerospora sp.]
MTDVVLEPGDRLDDLIINDLKIIQRDDQFRFSLDAILLAHFATVRTHTVAVDLGTGTGVIALLLAVRGATQVTGVEISPVMAELAARSVKMNQLAGRISIQNADLRNLRGQLPAGVFDLVVSNPPYRSMGKGFLNPNDKVAMARHEITATLDEVVAAARYLIKYRGRFAMVHLPERIPEILEALRRSDIEPKRLRLVHSSINKKPNMVLVEGVRGAKSGLEVLPPLIVYDSKGKYCPEILAWYQGETPL